MKKYELIKQYPGSDHVGVVVLQKTPNGMYEGWEYNYYKRHVENNPEYWEEVVGKDYEVLIAKIAPYTILSVKRLSDGEVFTVGDKVKVYEHGSIKTITEISTNLYPLVKEGILLGYDLGGCHLSHAIKGKQPIFLTHDGKDIFEEDKVWYVNKENLYHDYIIAFPEIKFNSEIRAYFLTREEAEDYIVENKVLFITEDGVGIKKGDTYYFVDTNLKISLAPNASTGAGLFDERKYFSTYDTALYYVIVNAKVLSIEEFWEFVSKPGNNIVKQKQLKRLVKERLNLK